MKRAQDGIGGGTARVASRRAALALALLVPAPSGAAAQQDGKESKAIVEDMNPRAPTTPLKIEFEPYWCSECFKEGVIKEKKELTFYRATVENLCKRIETDPKQFIALESPHFRILSSIDGASVKWADGVYAKADVERLRKIQPKIQNEQGGVKLDAHQRVHLYQIRLEREYAHFSALTGVTKPYLGMPVPYEIYLFADYTQHHAFVDSYIGGRADKGGVQHHERTSPDIILFSCAESIVATNLGKGDGPLTNHVMHNVAHCLIDGCNGYYRETPAWIEEGLAHYYERRESPRWNNFCWSEGKPPTDFTKPDWETTIYSLVRRGKDSPFSAWCELKQPGEMNGVQNGLSWGLVKWMIDTEPLRFAKVVDQIDDLQKNPSSADMIQEAYGVTVSVLHQRWRDWVLKEWAGK